MRDADKSVQIGGGRVIRAAEPGDIGQIRACICEAIDTSPFYNAEFKAFEKARLNENVLRALVAADPWFVPVVMFKGEFAGFVVTIPDCGVLWASWIYIHPRFRQTAIAVAAVGFLVRRWDNNRFHKTIALVRPENTAAEAVNAHFGFKRVAVLPNHMFGQDYVLMERPFNRTVDVYDPPLDVGRLTMLRLKLRQTFGLD